MKFDYPGYQVTFAHQIREMVNVPVIAVGLLEDPMRAESIIQSGEGDRKGFAS